MSLAREKCVEGDCYGTRMSRFVRRQLFISFGVLTALIINSNIESVCGQAYRRPSHSGVSNPALEAYRNRWLEYLKLRSPSSTTGRPFYSPSWPGLRVGSEANNSNNNNNSNKNTHGNQEPLVVNGFICERTFSFFSNKNNPRMYHLCARRSSEWYVYHYFCPSSTIFNESMKKCMVDKSPTISTTTARATTVRPRRTSSTTPLSTTTTLATTMRTTTTTAITPSSEAVPEAEPGVTESNIFSSEESSTEDEVLKDVVISNADSSSSSSDEAEEVNSENYDEGSDESNMIHVHVSANDHDNGPPTPTQMDKKTTKTKGRSGSNTQSKKSPPASGGGVGRRPRLLKKWRLQSGKY